mgnify:CR=1 FL=1
MRFIETLSRSVDDRLTAPNKKELHKKVANSKRPQHRGYPDETGYVPYIVADPEHNSHISSSVNVCADSDSDRATVFTAMLDFPHLPIKKHKKVGFTIKKLVSRASVNSYEVLSDVDKKCTEVLRERERKRMNAISEEHRYSTFGDKILTTDEEEKIIINAYRAAESRVGENPTADDVRTVLDFERNSFDKHLSFDISEITDEMVFSIVNNKTCSPILPQNKNQQKVLLYWIENPEATLSDVIDNTGVSRGKFETFRLNLPPVQCYNYNYIKQLDFDKNNIVSKLQSNMENSEHPVYNCSECKDWSYTSLGLSNHKKNNRTHSTTRVLDSEKPIQSSDNKSPRVNWNSGEATVDDMLENFNSNTGAINENEEITDEEITDEEITDEEPEGVEITTTDSDSVKITEKESNQDITEYLTNVDEPVKIIEHATGKNKEELVKVLIDELSGEEINKLKDNVFVT